MTIDAQKLLDVFKDCLFKSEEVVGSVPPSDAVIVEGITHKFGFHAERLESHRVEIQAWLAALPPTFRETEGGGWPFLEAYMDEDGRQWGEHLDMEQLFSLGLALGLVKELLPREMWGVLPGGMPYYSVKMDQELTSKD